MSYQQEIPNVLSPQDRDRLTLANELDIAQRVQFYEEMIDRYSHPFFLVRLADLFILLKADTLAVDLYRKVQVNLSSKGIVDSDLDAFVNAYGSEVDHWVSEVLKRAREVAYHQKWRPTNQHRFPTNLPQLPAGSQEVKDLWKELAPEGSIFCNAYMTKLAIETNHVESTFVLTEESVQDLVRRGVSEGTITVLPQSSLQDSAKIKDILNDTLAAYKLLYELCDNLGGLDKPTICRVHSRLMNTCQYSDLYYAPAGKTRTETRKTVKLAGAYKIECCPFPDVDGELEYICRMAKQWIKSWRNPFATASWIHLILARCHPFERGNGRMARLLASIPLMNYGYPPICVGLTQRAEYYAAINKAYEGDHGALTQSIFHGMKETIASVQSL